MRIFTIFIALLFLQCSTRQNKIDEVSDDGLKNYLNSLDSVAMIDLDYYLIIPAETCPFCIKQILLFFDFNQLIQSEKKIRYIVPALSRKKIINTFPQKFRTNSNVTIDTTKYYYQNSIFSDSPQLFYCKNGKVLKKKVLLASDIEKELEALSRNFSKD